MVGRDEYEHAMVAASEEVQELLKERARIDERLSRLKNTIDGLAALLTPSPSENSSASWSGAMAGLMGISFPDISEAGISDAIRQILADSKLPITAPQIRDALTARKVELSQYANPLAVIHNTLTRLEKQGEVIRHDLPSGTVYSGRKTLGQRLKEYATEQRQDPSALANAITKAKQQRSGMPAPPKFEDK
jgi:predicted  nucleic acid-binding Zn-ribbon protein